MTLKHLGKLSVTTSNMTIHSIEGFKTLDYEVKEGIFQKMSEQFEKAENDNDGNRINRIEKTLTRVLTTHWNNTSTKAINKALKTFPKNEKRFSQKDSDRVLSSLNNSYKGVEKKTKKRVESDIREIYEVNKRLFGRKFSLSSGTNDKEKLLFFKTFEFEPISKKVIEVNKTVFYWSYKNPKKKPKKKIFDKIFKAVKFGAVDKGAYENIARLENVAIGDHFPITLKPRVSSILQEALEKGLNHQDASAFLSQRLTETLGGNIASALPASVATGKASTTAYFEMLNATNVTYARNFSNINLMREAEISRLIFNAIIDRVTSVVCNQMNGRVFTIEQAMEHQVSVLDAVNVEALQGIAPFTRNLKDFNLKAGEKLTSTKTSARLAAAGVIVPPLHGRCYKDDTEVLTNTGWKLFKDVEPVDKIFSLNPDNLIPEYVDYRMKQEYSFKGELVHLTNSQHSLDMAVTPDHPMFYFKRVDGGSKGRSLQKFYGEMDTFLKAGKEARVYLSSKYQGEDIKTVDVCGLEMKSEHFCEFMGYYLSDGTTKSTGNGSASRYAFIAQQIGGAKMLERLKIMGFKNVTKTKATVNIYDTRIGKYCEQFGFSPVRYVPEIIKRMSKNNIRVFLDAFNSCDGSLKKATNFKNGNFEDTKVYFTTSKQLSSDLGELLIKVGKTCSYGLEERKGNKQVFKNGTYVINHNLWIIREINSKFRVPRIVNKIPYDGIVYDLELKKNHIMLVRRNGKVVWGTNCRSELNPA